MSILYVLMGSFLVPLSPHLRPNYTHSTVTVCEKQFASQIKPQDVKRAFELSLILFVDIKYKIKYCTGFYLVPV